MTDEATRRAQMRDWIRTHHPDRGGDPDEFIAGLEAWRAGRVPGEPATTVSVHRSMSTWGYLRRWARRRRQAKRNPRVR